MGAAASAALHGVEGSQLQNFSHEDLIACEDVTECRALRKKYVS